MDKTALNVEPVTRAARALTQILAGTWFLNEGKQMLDRADEATQSSIEGKPRAFFGNSAAVASRVAGLALLLSPAAHGAGRIARGAGWTLGKGAKFAKNKRFANWIDTYSKNVNEGFHHLGTASDLKIPLPISVPLSMGVPVVMDAFADQMRGKPVPNVPGLTGWLQMKLFGKNVPDTGSDADIPGAVKEQTDKVVTKAGEVIDKLKHPKDWFKKGLTDGEQKIASQEKEAILPVLPAAAGYAIMALFAALSAKQTAQGIGQTASGIGSGDWKKTLGGLGNTGLGLAGFIPAGGVAVKGIPAIMARLYRGNALRQGMKIAPELAAATKGKDLTRAPGIWNGIKNAFTQADHRTMSRLQTQMGAVKDPALLNNPQFLKARNAMAAYERSRGWEKGTDRAVRAFQQAVTPAPVAWGMNKWDRYVGDNLRKVPGVGGFLPTAAGMAGYMGAQNVVDRLAPLEAPEGETEAPVQRGNWRNIENPMYRRFGQGIASGEFSSDPIRNRLYQQAQNLG